MPILSPATAGYRNSFLSFFPIQPAFRLLNGTVQALFYDAGTQVNTSMGKLSVSAPCALILKREDGSVSVTAADGLMNRNLGRLDISLGAKQFSLSLPSGEALGKAVTWKFSFSL